MQTNVETQHKHMYSLYIGSLCIVAFPMARFTCIVTIYIALSSTFFGGAENIYE